MATVIAAIDNSAAAQPVLAAAVLLADLVGAGVEAVHVRENGSQTAEAAARKAGVELRFEAGPVIEGLIRAGREPGVAALVLGARGTPAGRRPAGSVALEVITALAIPVLVVPPEARLPGALRRVLVPLNGTAETAAALRETIELACDRDIEVVLLHVHDADSMPLFGDQPQHETDAWEAEFLARHAPCRRGSIRVETRVGASPAHVAQAVEETEADLVALGWAQDLSGGRAAVVRHALDVSSVGVLLVPVARPTAER